VKSVNKCEATGIIRLEAVTLEGSGVEWNDGTYWLIASATVLPALRSDALFWLQGVHAQIAEASALKTLTPDQDATVTTIAELIIPQTDTPGAKAAKVNEFIDLILSEW
jgi:hypothetical protein